MYSFPIVVQQQKIRDEDSMNENDTPVVTYTVPTSLLLREIPIQERVITIAEHPANSHLNAFAKLTEGEEKSNKHFSAIVLCASGMVSTVLLPPYQ
jgi:hypothetical protein